MDIVLSHHLHCSFQLNLQLWVSEAAPHYAPHHQRSWHVDTSLWLDIWSDCRVVSPRTGELSSCWWDLVVQERPGRWNAVTQLLIHFDLIWIMLRKFVWLLEGREKLLTWFGLIFAENCMKIKLDWGGASLMPHKARQWIATKKFESLRKEEEFEAFYKFENGFLMRTVLANILFT